MDNEFQDTDSLKLLRERGDRLDYKKEIDPHGLTQHQLGAKLDDGKPDTSLLLMFGKALLAVAEVGTFGAKKYTRGGWQTVAGGKERYTAALLRHLFKSFYEDYDPDSRLLHLDQVAWNALAISELAHRAHDDCTKVLLSKEDCAIIDREMDDGRNTQDK